jgi:translation initiation factor IF-1
MSKQDLVTYIAIIKSRKGGDLFVIEMEDGRELSARLSGKLKKFRIRINTGDKVTVGFSPYDTNTGIIIERMQKPPTPPMS